MGYNSRSMQIPPGPNTKQTQPEDEYPEGVKLRDYDDYDTLRGDIFDKTRRALASSFPVNYGSVRLELDDVDYDGPDSYDLAQQKAALLGDKYLTRKLRGHFKLYDNNTGELLDQRKMSLMKVPYLTERGTFIHGGNEYSTVMQSRLLPGVYTRRQENGILETQFQVKRGTGTTTRVWFEPDTTQYRLKIQQANLHLYSLLKDLGVNDEELERRWGKDILDANKSKYDARVFEKAYQRLVAPHSRNDKATREDKAAAIKAALDGAMVHRRVAEKNLPNMFNRKLASEWSQKGMAKEAAVKALDSLPFNPDLAPDDILNDLWGFSFDKRAAVADESVLEALLRAKKYSDDKNYGRKQEVMDLLLKRYPGDFFIDSRGPNRFSGITHGPTGFRMHLPSSTIPPGIHDASRPQVDSVDEVAGAGSGYREGGTFTHEGRDYDLDTPGPDRVRRADLSAPILVAPTDDGQETTVVDGLHRLAKAVEDGVTHLPGKRVELQKQAAQFEPDLSPDDLRESYNSIYGHVGPRLASMKEWPEEWINPQDPMGWLQWYEQYHHGRRSEDDERQIRRWKSFKARHGSQLKQNPTPRRAFALRNWAIDPLKLIDNEAQRIKLKEDMASYKQKKLDDYAEKKAAFDEGELSLLAQYLNYRHGAALPLLASQEELEDKIVMFLRDEYERERTHKEASESPPHPPGLPDRSDYGKEDALSPGEFYSLLIQKHMAERAGEHYDYRIGNPDIGLLSWASRKPLQNVEEGDRIQLFPQPLHTWDYKDFEGEIPQGYGKGRVYKDLEEKILLTHKRPGVISFSTTGKYPRRYNIIKTPDGKYLLQKGKMPEAHLASKAKYKDVHRNDIDEVLRSLKDAVVQAKVDGALAFMQMHGGKPEIVSHRISRTTGKPIVHTERVFGKLPHVDLPESIRNAVIKAELYGERDGKAIPTQELSGILNATLANSLQRQRDQGVNLKLMPFDVVSAGGQDTTALPYSDRLKIIEELLQYMPADKFTMPETAKTPEESLALLSRIRNNEYPLTSEGVVIHPEVGQPMRSKLFDETDVYIRDTFPAEDGSKYADNNIPGGFTYSYEADGPIIGKVGTGFSDEMRASLRDYVGRVARVQSHGKFEESGALRAPSLITIHESK